ncbi:hypothetical protein MSAN_02117900 [Mycena sanguinolenta]|uniref:F-box domain-containing protein n=1 Tax=Mycena sanguinolenta TaxID=230812 RepID=A0A8H7CKC2_9AGAR|nr:hypothetical protein MSAN_02117900 [Mycena sanguinolenta]
MVLTRRTHRERMEISRWLPNETIVEIIQHSTKADQATLVRVSKLFRDLCLPVLYRVVELDHKNAPNNINSFCSVIMKNPSRANAVRSFTVILPWPRNDTSRRTKRCKGLLLASLKLMSKLNHLLISSLDDYTCILLQECNFPQLTSCNLLASMYYDPSPESADSVTVFLVHHPTLRRLHLNLSSGFASLLGRVTLPNLEYYEGGAGFVLVLDAISLKEVRLRWNSKDVDKIITTISSITKADVPFISSHKYSGGICYQIMSSMSMHMRHTKTLRLSPLAHHDALPYQDTIRHITECLPRFTGLLYLAMEWSKRTCPTSGANKHEDRIAVEGWGEACPTLEGCCLNHSCWRKVDGRWENYPVREFWVLAGLPDLAARY